MVGDLHGRKVRLIENRPSRNVTACLFSYRTFCGYSTRVYVTG